MNTCKPRDNFIFKLTGPRKLCPLAYYSIFPYSVALCRGAWFRWEKSKDEVICQCPKPEGVVFLVKNKHKLIGAEVINQGKTCPYQYPKGRIFKIGPPALSLNKKTCFHFPDNSRSKIRVIDFKAPCLFFRKRGEKFGLDELVPEQVCPDLFYNLYPLYLTLLYDGNPSQTTVCCPGVKGKTFWHIKGEPLILSPLLNLLEKFFRLMGKPKDLVDKKIIIELIKSEGICPKKYKNRTSFSFNHYLNLFGKHYFCPALFYTIYPFLNTKTKNLRLQCPAVNSAIIVEVTR